MFQDKLNIKSKGNDMMFKDKSILGGADYNPGKCNEEAMAGRVGMEEYRLQSLLGSYIRAEFPTNISWGGVINPQGPYGMRANTMGTSFGQVNPMYSQKQIAAMLALGKFMMVGPGANAWVYTRLLRQQIGSTFGYSAPAMRMPGLTLFELQYPVKGEPTVADTYSKEFVDLIEKLKSIPKVPDPLFYGVEIPSSGELDAALNALMSLALSQPDLDVEKAVKDTAKIANSILAEQHIKDGKAKFKEYFTALGDFYKKYYPEFYSKEWSSLLEKQYKVW